MAKINLDNVAGGYNLSAINNNSTRVEDAFNNGVLWRNNPGGEPNSMGSDLDMDSNRIYNLPDPVESHEAVPLGWLQDYIQGGPFAKNLRVADVNIPALPNAGSRANKLLSFDAQGNPTVQFPSADSATQLRIDLAQEDGASLVNYRRASVNALTRSIQQMLDQSFVTPAEFGAVGDGVTDDTVAIQAAWDFSAANKKPCLMTDGDYRISFLRLRDNLHVMFSNNAWLKPVTWNAPGAFITNVNPEDVSNSRVENVLIENLQFDGININTSDIGNSNCIGVARGAVNVKFLGGTIKNLKYSFNAPGGAGGKAIGVEQGVVGFYASNFWIENCSIGIFAQGVPGVWLDGTPRNAVGIHFSDIHCENTEAWGFFAGVTTTAGSNPTGDFAQTMVVVRNITYHNSGHAPNRPIATDHKKSAPLVLGEATGIDIDGVIGYNDPDYPMVNPGYPTDPALIGSGLSGPIGAVVWGWGRNCSIRNVSHQGDVDSIVHIERARAHGDDAAPTGTPTNVFRFNMTGIRHFGVCNEVMKHGIGFLGPDIDMTGQFDITADQVTSGFVSSDWGMSNGVSIRIRNAATSSIVEGTPFWIRSFRNTFVVGDYKPYYDQLSARIMTAGRYTSGSATINDDAVLVLTPGQQHGIIQISSNTSLLRVIVGYRCSATGAQTAIIGPAISNVAVTTGVLTGTTGTDGNFTISADAAGNLYLENRRGGATEFVWSFSV